MKEESKTVEAPKDDIRIKQREQNLENGAEEDEYITELKKVIH